jgi:hypothetical protein
MKDTPAALRALADTEPEDFEGLATESVLRLARTLIDWPADAVPQALHERMSSEDAELVKRIEQEKSAPVTDVGDCVEELHQRRRKREGAELQEKIARMPKTGSTDNYRKDDALFRRKERLQQDIDRSGERDSRQVPRAPGV